MFQESPHLTHQNSSNMKIVLKKKQFEKINEENNINVSLNANGNTIPAMTNAITQNRSDITNAGKMGDPILHISNPSSQNGSNDSSITQHVEVGQGESIESAMQDQLNPTATSTGGDVEVSGDGLKEVARYTKKQVQEARLKQRIYETVKRVLENQLKQ